MVLKWDVRIPHLSGDMPRKAYLYLPESYTQDPSRRYPVMYMFDGHNVFFDEDASYGQSWRMKDYMDSFGKQLIIVAVECNHEGNRRLVEYSPLSFRNSAFGVIRGRGRTYMDWLVYELKPYIDGRLRTLPDRENTYICGSSMGGLMSLYAVTQYNHIFQRAACLSPSVWVAPSKFIGMIAKSTVRPDTIVYMDYGSEEMLRHSSNREALASTVRMLLMKNVNLTFRVVPHGTHTEACWAEQVPYFMECLEIE
ncbi:MAG: alpha/beta hydrolase [Oscillospiraceae bacterium]|nr:alpha/beta hydrolase [Oscillospiraceae bacterium]